MRKLCCAAAIVVIAAELTITGAWAHGVVGDYVFLEPLVAEDPTPANELDIVQPQWTRTSDGKTLSIGTSIEKVLGLNHNEFPVLSAGVGTSWNSV